MVSRKSTPIREIYLRMHNLIVEVQTAEFTCSCLARDEAWHLRIRRVP